MFLRAFQNASSVFHECFKSAIRVFQGFHDDKDILEKVFDKCDDIFEKVSDGVKDMKLT